MQIDTHVPGDPDGLRTLASWLRTGLSAEVSDATTRLTRAGGLAESGWTGRAANAFATRMSSARAGGDTLAEDAIRLGDSVDSYADALHTAKIGMRRAREIAREAGLTVSEGYIRMPDGAEEPLTRTAWKFVQEEVHQARAVLTAAEKTGREAWRVVTRKKYLRAAEFVNDAAGLANDAAERILRRRASTLSQRAAQLAKLGRTAVRSHLGRGLFRSASAAAEHAGSAAHTAGKIAGKLGKVGPVLTGAGIAIDIADGTPPAKAVMTGVTGAVVGTVVGDATAAAVSSVASPAVGIPVGIATGFLAGEVAGAGAGMLYDVETKVVEKVYHNVVPDVVKHHIPKSVKSLAHKLF
jgi:hypothetical protein